MSHLRLFMEVTPYSVTAQIAYHAIVILLGMFLDSLADVIDKTPRLGSLHSYLQTLLRDTHQLFLLRRCLTDDEHTRGVGIVTIEDSGEVDIDDVPLLQNVFCLGNTMTDHLVDTRTDTHGKRLRILIAAIVQTGGNRIVHSTIVAAYLINL